jgi:hypothetical protein
VQPRRKISSALLVAHAVALRRERPPLPRSLSELLADPGTIRPAGRAAPSKTQSQALQRIWLRSATASSPPRVVCFRR